MAAYLSLLPPRYGFPDSIQRIEGIKKYPSTPVFGATVLRLHEDGRIASQRDYYDLWGDIFNGIPKFKPMYRNFMRRKFG